MRVFVVTNEFSSPVLGIRLHVSDTVGKIESRTSVLIDGVQYSNQAFWDWVESVDGEAYLQFVGIITDPSIPGVSNIQGGSMAITSGNNYVNVSASWGFVPTKIAVVVTKPDGGDNLFATVRESTITASGFAADLSAPASSSGYKLWFIAVE
jgi:hypothetical protein